MTFLVHGYVPYGSSLTTVRHFYSKSRTVFQLRRGLSTLLNTVRDCSSHRTGSFPFVHFKRHLSYVPYGFPIHTIRYVLFPAFSWCTCQLLGRITTRNHPDLQVCDTGHSLLFVGVPRTGSFPTSKHTHRTGFPPRFLQPSCFLHTVRAAKTLKTKNLHKEQTSFLSRSRKKFYLRNQLCSFRCAKVSKNPTHRKM